MPVIDDQVATLRAHLAGDAAEYRRLYETLDRRAAEVGYTALVTAAFCTAVDRRFGERAAPESEVIEYVGDVRARSEKVSKALDARAAERVILAVYADEDVDDLDTSTKAGSQLMLLTALVTDEGFEDAELDAFLAQSRKLADRMIG